MDSDGDVHVVCDECLAAGADEIPNRLENSAFELEAWAARLRTYAKRRWILPSTQQQEKSRRGSVVPATTRILARVPIRATLLLADSAQAVGGKLYILGGGWNITGPSPVPSAIAMYVEIPWDLTNVKHPWRLELMDSDGQPVMIHTPVGEQAFVLQGELEVGRPPGTQPGVGLGVPMAINLGPIPLQAGGRYEWRLYINDTTDENWRLPFSTRPAAAPSGAAPEAG
jgi:hypothetical protein